jgi:N-methylhydantoinase A/oxoprolinase/acetone carboxylase beta subunit
MRTVFMHRFCGILSAFGMGLSDVVAGAYTRSHFGST